MTWDYLFFREQFIDQIREMLGVSNVNKLKRPIIFSTIVKNRIQFILHLSTFLYTGSNQ